jgi:hypothetical protein
MSKHANLFDGVCVGYICLVALSCVLVNLWLSEAIFYLLVLNIICGSIIVLGTVFGGGDHVKR